MHVDKPKDQDLVGHAITKFHLISSLTFLKTTRTSKKPLYSHGSTQIKISSPHFALFSLKERARSSLESSLKLMGQHLKRKRKLHIISSSYSLKESRKLKDSLKLSTSHTFRSSHQEREIFSCKSDSIPIFPL